MELTKKTEEPLPAYDYDFELKKLTIRGQNDFPNDIFKHAGEIEILDASNNNFTDLPDNLPALKNMRVAFLSGNHFTKFPSVLALCEKLEMIGLKSCGIEYIPEYSLPPSLRGLILTDNNLTGLPASIAELTALQKLMLTGNNLREFPAPITEFKNLELLRISDNGLEKPPLKLSSMPKLAWCADSGNNYNQTSNLESLRVTKYDWSDILFGQKLGESAKNVVYAATISGKEVAIKLFGKGITTDGSSENDILASLLVGSHPNIIGGLGTIVSAPDGQEGLVMPIIHRNFKPLGYPPNLTDLTRDSYAPDLELASETSMTIACDIARALSHMHAAGVMHGDVYAHNILTDASGRSIIGDFGAASVYDKNSKDEIWREKIDVMGYGRLVDELIMHTIANAADELAIIERLKLVVSECCKEASSERLTFKDIVKLLE